MTSLSLQGLYYRQEGKSYSRAVRHWFVHLCCASARSLAHITAFKWACLTFSASGSIELQEGAKGYLCCLQRLYGCVNLHTSTDHCASVTHGDPKLKARDSGFMC